MGIDLETNCVCVTTIVGNRNEGIDVTSSNTLCTNKTALLQLPGKPQD